MILDRVAGVCRDRLVFRSIFDRYLRKSLARSDRARIKEREEETGRRTIGSLGEIGWYMIILG
jgi:hypothetical protein